MNLPDVITELRDIATTSTPTFSASDVVVLHQDMTDPDADIEETVSALGLDWDTVLFLLGRYSRSLIARAYRAGTTEELRVRTLEQVSELPMFQDSARLGLQKCAQFDPDPETAALVVELLNHAVPYGTSWDTATLLVRSIQADRLEDLMSLTKAHKAPGLFARGVLAAHNTLQSVIEDTQEALDEILVSDTRRTLRPLLARVSFLGDRNIALLTRAVRLLDDTSPLLAKEHSKYVMAPAVVPTSYAELTDGQIMRAIEQLGLDSSLDVRGWVQRQRRHLQNAGVPTTGIDLTLAAASRAYQAGFLLDADEAVQRRCAGDPQWASHISEKLAV